TAVLAGGCFWGVEAVFDHVTGVLSATSGFADGTPHGPPAEAVRIVYDPTRVTYAQLLDVFFAVAHDPTQVDRQGPDVGPEYRSVVFYRTAAQRRAADSALAALGRSGTYRAPIATQVAELVAFHEAPAAHQEYVAKHPESRYVVLVDLPKLAHFRAARPAMYRP
ncbi:MAG: peptide-methionine (S)-S-oxide reductase MsrA, partial [Gemmatirosa sp.]|nr:peptide-methionine (S)-S-oxide reductase MsrA [Gemmatirosa sp.]